jgi:hypothetical protein
MASGSRSLVIVGNADASTAHEDLLLAVPRSSSSEDLVDHSEKRPAEEVVDLDPLAGEHLRRDLWSREQATDPLLTPEE